MGTRYGLGTLLGRTVTWIARRGQGSTGGKMQCVGGTEVRTGGYENRRVTSAHKGRAKGWPWLLTWEWNAYVRP
jgi:hypothetical protein